LIETGQLELPWADAAADVGVAIGAEQLRAEQLP
jgi:hypothetical protein